MLHDMKGLLERLSQGGTRERWGKGFSQGLTVWPPPSFFLSVQISDPSLSSQRTTSFDIHVDALLPSLENLSFSQLSFALLSSHISFYFLSHCFSPQPSPLFRVWSTVLIHDRYRLVSLYTRSLILLPPLHTNALPLPLLYLYLTLFWIIILEHVRLRNLHVPQ